MEGYKLPIPEGQLPLYLWPLEEFHTWVCVCSGLLIDCKCELSLLQHSFDHAPSYSHDLFKFTLVSLRSMDISIISMYFKKIKWMTLGLRQLLKIKVKKKRVIHAISWWTEGWQGRELHPTPCPPPPDINFCFQRPSHKDNMVFGGGLLHLMC